MNKLKNVKINCLKFVTIVLLCALTTCTLNLMLSNGERLAAGPVKVEGNASSSWGWTLIIALIFPDVLSFGQNGFGRSRPNISCIFITLVLKIAQTIGMCILFFIALPELSATEGAIVTAGLLLKCFIDARKKRIWIDVFAVSCQFGTLILWVALRSHYSQIWSLLIGLFLTSLGWWSSWLPENDDGDQKNDTKPKNDEDDNGSFGVFKKMRYLANKCKVTKKEKHSLNQGGILARILESRFPGNH
jgi:hypothetical protein